MAIPYGQGYGAVDTSAAAQRRMAEQKTLKSAWLAEGTGKDRIPVYKGPSRSSGELEDAGLTGENFYDHDIYVLDETKPSWLFHR